MNLKQLVKAITDANDIYGSNKRNTDGISDHEYDKLLDQLRAIDPNHLLLKQIGFSPASIPKKKRVKLPFILTSINKIKFSKDNAPEVEHKLSKWMKKHSKPSQYVLSYKYDGVSALIVVKNKKPTMYTRGNATIGGDITNLLPWIELPSIQDDYAVRGELIISKSNFIALKKSLARTKSDKKSDTIPKVARNVVAGIVNAKNPNPKVLDALSFVAYECIHFNGTTMRPSKQFKLLKSLGFKTVPNTVIKKLSIDYLLQALEHARHACKHEIDGVIVAHDAHYQHITEKVKNSSNEHDINTDKNPDHMFAFKNDTVVQQTTILDIIYGVSKDGNLKPRAKMEKTIFNGAEIEYATLYNGKFVVDNKLGKGAQVVLTMGGDIIPKIIKTIKPADHIGYPKVAYQWDKNKVEFIIKGNDKTVQKEMFVKRLINFCDKMSIDHVNKGLITKFVDNGVQSIKDFIDLDKKTLMKMDGIQTTLSDTVLASIKASITNVPIETLMVASNCFGPSLGVKSLKTIATSPSLPILDIVTDKIHMTRIQLIHSIESIDGFSTKRANDFVDGIGDFVQLLKNNPKIKIAKPIADAKVMSAATENQVPLKSFVVVFSGFRDNELKDLIESKGGTVTSAVSKKTTHLVVKDVNASSGKIKDAKEKGVTIMSIEGFKTMVKKK